MTIRKGIALILTVLLLLSFAGCGAAVDKAYDSNGGVAPGALADGADDFMVKEEASADAESGSALPENRKLIQTVEMSVETEDLDTVLRQVEDRVSQLDGYIEASYVQNGSAYSGRRYRNATITARIPAQSLEQFVDQVGEVTNIVSSQKSVEDVTLSYVATESRMKALQTEEARLLELLAQAETMDDLLTVEARLTEVRTELEQVTTALRVFDNQVDYATVHLDIDEVTEYTEVTEPETVWQRISAGFKKSLKGVGNFLKELFVFIIVALPYLVLIAAIALGVVMIIRLSIRRKRKRNAKKNATDPEKP